MKRKQWITLAAAGALAAVALVWLIRPAPVRVDTAVVAWPEVQRICGARMSVLLEQPPRWAVDTFPNDEEWQALQAARVEP